MANEEIKEQENAEAEAETTQAQTENQETSQTETEGAAAQDETAAEEKTSETDEVTALKNKVEQLEKENADLKDQVLRRAADFENYRKRMIQEKQEAFDFANTNLLKDLLDSLDNFDRTVEAAATATDPKSIADGVSMISKSMVSMLENKYNLVSYGAVGDAFDPNIHEAIGMQEGDVSEEQLAAVYLKGYKLKDRVIRHAKVMVVKPKA
ncbi:nucleotide exchange factor GrpE [Treponema rectale]|uniref:Protein GrpE n=1 Tax=Treponema rectale TaxID=744512 RepID=A0A840SAE5_9SPIR|nr:nucleotide exchange factor GrpE [Treponema rectale]MBB5217680.1 molecular chaperone GrpE [Treponema rectale]QOS40588.1 nucleotide exchange factor GrpE [Treponema rectale]